MVAVKDNRLSILKALKKMATSSSKVEASLHEIYGDNGQYYRFVVNEGLGNVALSDWELASQISAHTHNYLKSQQKRMELYVKDFQTNPHSLASLRPESEGKATPETNRSIEPPNISKQAEFSQRGSVFHSIISGKEVKQGNRLEVTSPELLCSLVQEGSHFGGQVRADQKVEQGNRISL